MKLTASAAVVAVLGLLLAGCGGSSNTADYKACKAGIKADMVKGLSSFSSGQIPQNHLPSAAAAACSRLSHADMTRLEHEVSNELKNSPPPIASNPVASSPHFPARLLGLKRNTSPDARAAIKQGTSQFFADNRDAFRAAWGAVYGSHSGPAIIVYGATFTAPAAVEEQVIPGFDKHIAAQVTTSSGKGLRSFPAGAHGGALYCVAGPSSRQRPACLWVDKVGIGVVGYNGGAASSLSDAASKTNQIRAIIEPLTRKSALTGSELVWLQAIDREQAKINSAIEKLPSIPTKASMLALDSVLRGCTTTLTRLGRPSDPRLLPVFEPMMKACAQFTKAAMCAITIAVSNDPAKINEAGQCIALTLNAGGDEMNTAETAIIQLEHPSG